jgi:peptide chain release factor 1
MTDHRIGLTLHSLPQIMDGEIEEMIKALEDADYAQRIQELIK